MKAVVQGDKSFCAEIPHFDKSLLKRFLVTVPLLLFALLAPCCSWAGDTSDRTSFLGFSHDDGFCLRGTPEHVRWDPSSASGVPVWGSFCNDDQSQGRIVSDPFLAPSNLSFYVSGYAGNTGLRLYLRNLETQEEFDITPKQRGDEWRLVNFPLPENWRGKPVEMIGEDHATAGFGWFGLTAPRLPQEALESGYISTNRAQSGFCNDNKFPLLHYGNSPPAGVSFWRSYCSFGDADTGFLASEPFLAKAYAGLYMAGYPGMTGVRVSIENLNSKEQIPVQVDTLPRELWRFYYIPLPHEWKGQPLRVLAEDSANRPGGWVGVAVVRPKDWINKASAGLRLFVLFLALFLVVMLPSAAACVLGARRGISSLLDLTAVGLLTLGIVGYGAFWLYFLKPALGQTYSWTTLLASVAVLLWAGLRPVERRHYTTLRPLAAPFLLVAAASMFVLSLGFLYGKSNSLQEYGARRFGPPFLSVDNWLPKILADDVYQNHIPKPMIGDWLSSDRPPLQAGNALWNYAWTHGDRDLAYQIVGTILQLTFLAGLWTYLIYARASRKAVLLTMAAALFAGFTLENSFFVWPKLFPVGFLLIICAYLFTNRYYKVRADWRIGLVVGASAALAMLCHGGSAFGLFGIALTMLALRRVPTARFMAAVAAAAIMLMMPWSLYQKYYDPPGDRLLKMHLAGTGDPHPEIKFSTLLIKKYKEAGWHGVLLNKEQGFDGVFVSDDFRDRMSDIARFFIGGTREQRAAEVASLRVAMFLRWFWSIDLFCFVPVLWLLCLLLRRPRSPDFRQASLLWICTAFTLVTWCLLMFSGGTIVHQGCYFTEIAAFAAAVLTLWALSPRLAAIVVACHIAITFTIFVFLGPPSPVGVATSFGATNKVLICTTVLSALGYLLVLSTTQIEDGEHSDLHSGANSHANVLARQLQ